MPLFESLAEISLRILLEIVFYGLSYWTGFLALKVISFGTLSLAPLGTIDDRNRGKKKKKQIDWSIWLNRPLQGKAIKAEVTCLMGILCWGAIGLIAYLATSET